MQILTLASVYSILLILISILGLISSGEPAALLAMPFALAILSFAWVGRRSTDFYAKSLQTTLIIAFLLLLGTGGGFVTFLKQLASETAALNPVLIPQAIIFLLSLWYSMIGLIYLAKK